MGELHHIRRPEWAAKNRCRVCEPPEECPLVRLVDPGEPELAHRCIFEAFGVGVDVLVDNSKKPAWATRFTPPTDCELRYVHLVRDPRALVRRWSVTYDTRKSRAHARWVTARRLRSPAVLVGSQLGVYAAKWYHQNSLITDFLGTRPPEHSIVATYRDLALAPEDGVRRIAEWLDLEWEPGQLEYWNVEHHGSQKIEYEWVKEKHERFIDLRWREFLSAEQQRDIVTGPRVGPYLEQLALAAVDDGLTASP